MTGAYSVHTIYEGHEIMFHVSTLLPYSKDNKQQVSDVSRAAHDKGKQSGLFQPAGPRAQNAIFHRWCSNESFLSRNLSSRKEGKVADRTAL
jgi:Rap/ran-GAP